MRARVESSMVETIARSSRPRSRTAATISSSRPASLMSRSISTRSSGGSRKASSAPARVSGSRRSASCQSWATISGSRSAAAIRGWPSGVQRTSSSIVSTPAATAAPKLSSVFPGAIRSAPLWPTRRSPLRPSATGALEELVLAGEDLGHRVVGENAADRVGEGRRRGEDRDVVGGAGTQRQRVGDDDLLDRRVGQALVGGTGEDAVGGAGDHPRGALVEHGLGGGEERSRRVDHVVDEDGGLALDVADHVADLGDLLGRAL